MANAPGAVRRSSLRSSGSVVVLRNNTEHLIKCGGLGIRTRARNVFGKSSGFFETNASDSVSHERPFFGLNLSSALRDTILVQSSNRLSGNDDLGSRRQ